MNLYAYVLNNPLRYFDPDGRIAFAIPLFIWGAELVLPTLSAVVVPIAYGVITGAVAYGGYTLVTALNSSGYVIDHPDKAPTHLEKTIANWTSNKLDLAATKKEKNTNPFDGPVDQDVMVGDADGNVIPVKEGNWLTGSKDGKWIQEKKPGANTRCNKS